MRGEERDKEGGWGEGGERPEEIQGVMKASNGRC